MRYCDLKVGDGPEAELGLFVGIHFEGFRLNGRPVESSWNEGAVPKIIEAGSTPEFPALGEGVVGMREGGRRELVVPPMMNRPGVEEVMTYTLDLYKVAEKRRPGAPGSPPGGAGPTQAAPSQEPQAPTSPPPLGTGGAPPADASSSAATAGRK